MRSSFALLVQVVALLLLLSVLASCQSTEPVQVEYDEGENVTRYETTQMRLKSSSNRLTAPSLNVQAFATCTGTSCEPSTYSLRFSLADGSRDLTMVATKAIMWTDGRTIEWENPFPGIQSDEAFAVRGEITTVGLTKEEFARVARSQRVRGEIGGIEYTFPYSYRDPMRDMFARSTGQAPANAPPSR